MRRAAAPAEAETLEEMDAIWNRVRAHGQAALRRRQYAEAEYPTNIFGIDPSVLVGID